MKKLEIMKLDIPELRVIEKSKAEKIKATFEPMTKMLLEFEKAFSEVTSEAEKKITKDVTIKAKRLRIDIGKVRTETGKLKDKQKEYIKLEDRAIMGVHNVLVWAVKEKEDKLKDIENFFEIQEQKRLEKLQSERVNKLMKYVEGAEERNLSGMDSDVWEAYFAAKKKEYNDQIAAEKQAEVDRIAKARKLKLHNDRKESIIDLWQFIPDAIKQKDFSDYMPGAWDLEVENIHKNKVKFDTEQERIRKDNIRMQKEAEIKAKQRQKEIAKAEAERKVLEEEARKEREASEAILKAEREAKAKLEKELIAKAEAERKAKREEQERIEAEEKAKKEADRKAKAAPDKAKLIEFANVIDGLVLPELKSEDANHILENTKELLTKVSNFIREKTSKI